MSETSFKYDPDIFKDLFDEDDCRKAEVLVGVVEKWVWVTYLHAWAGPFRTPLTKMYDAIRSNPRVTSAIAFNPDLDKRYMRALSKRGGSIKIGSAIYLVVFLLSYAWSFYLYMQGVPVPAEWTPMLVMFLLGIIVDRWVVKWETRRCQELTAPLSAGNWG